MAMMMSNFDDQESNDLFFKAQAHVSNLMFNFVTSMSLNCAIQLDIIEAIHKHGEPMTLSELVEALPINKARAPFVYRLMRLLVHSGFFVELNDTSKIATIGEPEVAYLLTPPSLLLLKNEQSSLRTEYLATVGPILGKPWHVLSEWLKNDDSTPFETAYGKSFWDFAGENPNFNDGFNEAMASESRSVAGLVIKECKGVFEGISSVVDVGGGTGVLARAIADAFPHLSCTVLDLPHVVANLKGSGNLSYVIGNMFESIHHADVVLLKSILHDWSDEECVKILNKCKEAIPSKESGGMAIIISVVVDNKNDEDYCNKSLRTKLLLDLLMMVQVGGKERTEKEWEKIFTSAGFSDYKITSSVFGLNSLIYVFP